MTAKKHAAELTKVFNVHETEAATGFSPSIGGFSIGPGESVELPAHEAKDLIDSLPEKFGPKAKHHPHKTKAGDK